MADLNINLTTMSNYSLDYTIVFLRPPINLYIIIEILSNRNGFLIGKVPPLYF